jgi:hypothetical protein
MLLNQSCHLVYTIRMRAFRYFGFLFLVSFGVSWIFFFLTNRFYEPVVWIRCCEISLSAFFILYGLIGMVLHIRRPSSS